MIRTDIETQQLFGLRRLLAELRQNRFYQRRIEAAGLQDGISDLADFCRRMPLTTRQELIDDQSGHPPYGTNLSYPLQAYSRVHATSGTQSAPLRWLDTPESWQWMLDNWKQVLSAAGAKAGDRVFFAFSFGPFLGFWAGFEAACQSGLLCLPGGGMRSLSRLQAIRDNGVTVLCCTPTYAIRLGEVARESGIDLAGSAVRLIVVAGEPGGSIPATREHIESMWPGARVFDHHGMTEVGPVTYQCPERPGTLRVIESAYLAEVLNSDSLQPVSEGEVGELVLTTLGRAGSPVLRYRTGDLVRPRYLNSPGTGPGPHLSLEGGILGRVDDMVLVRGIVVFPSLVDQIVRSDPRVGEYRVEIDRSGSMVQMTVLIELSGEQPGSADAARDLAEAFRHHLSLRVAVQAVDRGTLPTFEMKAKRWVFTQEDRQADR